MIAFALVSLCIFSSVLAYEPCNYTTEITMKRENIINDALDGAATFFLTTNQDNCSVNVDDIYEQINREVVKGNYNRTEALMEFFFL